MSHNVYNLCPTPSVHTVRSQIYNWQEVNLTVEELKTHFSSKSCYRSVLGLTGAGYAGRNELPTSHCSLNFLASLTIVYCRIKKLSTDNSSETLTQGLWNLESGQSTVMNINRTYRNGILVTNHRHFQSVLHFQPCFVSFRYLWWHVCCWRCDTVWAGDTILHNRRQQSDVIQNWTVSATRGRRETLTCSERESWTWTRPEWNLWMSPWVWEVSCPVGQCSDLTSLTPIPA